jgi:hypothetical protein
MVSFNRTHFIFMQTYFNLKTFVKMRKNLYIKSKESD